MIWRKKSDAFIFQSLTLRKKRAVHSFKLLNEEIIGCRLCPRLVQFRENAPSRSPYPETTYWRKPVPGFGDPKAWLLIIGLAPAPQGGNRTGRIFTGDKTAQFLMKALYRHGFANHPFSESTADGLILTGCYLTAAVKCVPPLNRPIRQEVLNCSRYSIRELQFLTQLTSVLALGKLAFDAYVHDTIKQKVIQPFKHGGIYPMEGFPRLYASYHPSPQNTNTGKLTETMFDELLQAIITTQGFSPQSAQRAQRGNKLF